MTTSEILQEYGKNSLERVQTAVAHLRAGKGVILTDSENRENEGDLIFSAKTITTENMALMIRACSGIVCLCLPESRMQQLNLPLMVPSDQNTSRYGTAFTISIEARCGVTTGVSAQDRVTTIRTATKDGAKAADLARPGHVFPLAAREGGVLERPGHTEGAVDLMRLAGLGPAAVLCEVMNSDGTMARRSELCAFAIVHDISILTIEDLIAVMCTTQTESQLVDVLSAHL